MNLQRQIKSYQEKQQVLIGFQEKVTDFTDLDLIVNQLDTFKWHERKHQFPFTFLNKVGVAFSQQRRQINEVNTILKDHSTFYDKKSISEEELLLQKKKIAGKFPKNQVFPVFQQALQNLTLKAINWKSEVLEKQIGKLTKENERLFEQNYDLKLGNSNYKGSINRSNNLQQEISSSSPFNKKHPLANTKESLASNTSFAQSKQVRQLQLTIKQYERQSLESDLFQQTLNNFIEKLQNKDLSWKKDIETLKKGSNGRSRGNPKSNESSKQSRKKYEKLFRISQIITRLSSSQEQQAFSLSLTGQQQPSTPNSSITQSYLLENDSESSLNNKSNKKVSLSGSKQSGNPPIKENIIQDINKVIQLILSQKKPLHQFQAEQILSHQIQRNPSMANFVILIESYLAINSHAKQLNQQLQSVRQSFDLEIKNFKDSLFQLQRKLKEQQLSHKDQISRYRGGYALCRGRQMQPNSGSGLTYHQRQRKGVSSLDSDLRHHSNAFQQDYQLQPQSYSNLDLTHSAKPLRSSKSIKSINSIKSIQSVGSSHASHVSGSSSWTARKAMAKNASVVDKMKAYYTQSIQQFSKQQKSMLSKIEQLSVEKQGLKKQKQALRSQHDGELKHLQEEVQYQKQAYQALVVRCQKFQADQTKLKKNLQNIIQQRDSLQIQRQRLQNQLFFQRQKLLIQQQKLQQQDLLSSSIKQTQNLSKKYQKQHLAQQSQYSSNKKEQRSPNTFSTHNTQNMSNNDNFQQYVNATKMNQSLSSLAALDEISQMGDSHTESSRQVYQDASGGTTVMTTKRTTTTSSHQPHITTTTATVHNQSSLQEQVQSLRMQLRQQEQERHSIIEGEVIKALRMQEVEFNEFLKKNTFEIEQYYEQTVIPQRQLQWQETTNRRVSTSTVTAPTVTSSTAVVTTTSTSSASAATNSFIPNNMSQQAYLHAKYEEWKLTYLPVILQLKYHEWLTQYEQKELSAVLLKKQQQWQSVHLKSIIQKDKHRWILDQLFSSKIQDMFHKHEQQLAQLKRQYNALMQKQQQQNTTIQATTKTFTQEQLNSILQQEHSEWQKHLEHQIQLKIQQVERYWQQIILPERRTEWQQSTTTRTTTTTTTNSGLQRNDNVAATMLLRNQQQAPQDINIIINEKYQEWKRTYLVEYLRLQKEKWLAWFRQNQLETIVTKRLAEWQSISLMSFLRESRNAWMLEELFRERKPVDNSKQIEARLRKEINTYWELTIIPQKQREWQTSFKAKNPPQKVDTASLEATWRAKYQSQIRKTITIEIETYWKNTIREQTLAFERRLEEALMIRTKEIETHFDTVVIPQIRKQQRQIAATATKTVTKAIQKTPQQKQAQIHALAMKQFEQWKASELSKQLTNSRTQWESQFLKSSKYLQILSDKDREWKQKLELEVKQRASKLQIEFKHQHQIELRTIVQTHQKQLQQMQRSSHASSQFEISKQRYEAQIRRLNGQINQHEQRNSSLRLQIDRLSAELKASSSKMKQIQRSTSSHTTIIQQSQQQGLQYKEKIYKMQNQHDRQLNQLKQSYQQRLSQLSHQKSLLTLQIKQLQAKAKSQSQQYANKSNNDSQYEKQILSLEATIKTKDSELAFIKRSLETSTLELSQSQNRIVTLSSKVTQLESSLEQARSHTVKYEYELKYWKEKEISFSKKIDSKEQELSELKSRYEFEKNLLEKKIRQLTGQSQNSSTLLVKISELESQLSIKTNNLRSLEQQLQRKSHQLEEERVKQVNLSREIQQYRNSARQHQNTLQDLRMESRRYTDEISKFKLLIESFEQRQREYKESLLQSQHKVSSRDANEFQALIRENQRLKQEVYRQKQHIIYLESQHSRESSQLHQYIRELQCRVSMSVNHHHRGDCTEIEVLKRINFQLADLVSTNKQLQMRIIVLENQKSLSAFGTSIERFFLAFQEQSDNLIEYMCSNGIFEGETTHSQYHRFQNKAREALTHGYVEDYFRQWQAFMRGLIEENLKDVNIDNTRNRGIKHTTKKSRGNNNSSQQLVEKYSVLLNDVKYALSEYLKSGGGQHNEQYLEMMARSLGLDIEVILVEGQEDGVGVEQRQQGSSSSLINLNTNNLNSNRNGSGNLGTNGQQQQQFHRYVVNSSTSSRDNAGIGKTTWQQQYNRQSGVIDTTEK